MATHVLAGALMRQARAEGGFATVLAKGDETVGAILVLLAERGTRVAMLERSLGPAGIYRWRESALPSGAENSAEDERFLQNRRRFDPDLWILELDVASAERFAAEMNAFD